MAKAVNEQLDKINCSHKGFLNAEDIQSLKHHRGLKAIFIWCLAELSHNCSLSRKASLFMVLS